MTKQTEIRMNLDGLDAIAAKVGGRARARVGVLGGDAARSGETKDSLNNATLLLIQMYGSLTRNIPPRDPLIEPILRHKREIMQGLDSEQFKQAFKRGDVMTMLKLLGIEAEAVVHEAFDTQGDGTWPPNAKSTIRQKGSSEPLIDTRQLERAISSDVVKDGGNPTASIQGAPS